VLLNFRTGDEQVAIEVSRDGEDWRLLIDGREVPLQARRDHTGAWLIQTHQGRRRLWVAEREDERLVFCDGRAHQVRLVDQDHDDPADDPAAGPNLVADMPGKIVKILVAAGQEVVAGESLLIIESMKMETDLAAATTGIVQSVHVTDGQVVSQGEALIDLDPK